MEKDIKKKKSSVTKKSDSAVINTKPQLPGVNEQDSAVANKDAVVEKVLSLSQRRQRAIQMHKNAPRLARGRKLAKPRMATDTRLRVRAEKMARDIARRKFAGQRGAEYQTLSPSDKIAVDKLIDKKVKLIKKLADRLMPRVKASEVNRLRNVKNGLGGSKEVKKGALASGPLFQSIEFKGLVDALLTEEYNEKMEKLLRLGLGDKDKLNQYRQALKNPEQSGKYAVLRGHLIKMLDKLSKLVTDDPSVFQKSKNKLQKERDYPVKKESEKVAEALIRKSERSGVPFEILSEVFNRGHAAWSEGMKHDAEQNAFNRVNSYISGGKARELDADLIESEVWDKPNPVKKHSKLSPKAKAKAKARAKSAGRPYPNMVDNIWAARNEEVNTKPKVKYKTPNREISTLMRGTDPVTEKFETSLPQSKDKNDSSSRLDATDSVVRIYKGDTPGEGKKSTISKIKGALKKK